MAIRFDGRDLTEEEQNALVDAITTNSDLRIGYLIDGAQSEEKAFARVIKEREFVKSPALTELTMEEEISPEELPSEPQELFHSEQPTEKNGQFYRGTLRSGQSIEVDGSIVILGDINPGAQVTAGGAACEEFRPDTLESVLVPGLHAAGEILDVDGDCGGFNLMFAFGSGILAGLNGRKPDF